jgi:hypothetical protein
VHFVPLDLLALLPAGPERATRYDEELFKIDNPHPAKNSNPIMSSDCIYHSARVLAGPLGNLLHVAAEFPILESCYWRYNKEKGERK